MTTQECQSCHGYGYFDEEDEPTLDRRGRKCLDCSGEGRVAVVGVVMDEVKFHYKNSPEVLADRFVDLLRRLGFDAAVVDRPPFDGDYTLMVKKKP